MRYVIAYDADCGPCTKFKEAIDLLDTRERIVFIPLIEADERGLLDGVPLQTRFRSMHLISPTGEVRSGGDALPIVARLLPLGGIVAGTMTSVPGVMSMIRFVYSTFARLHDLGSCGYSPVTAEAPPPPR